MLRPPTTARCSSGLTDDRDSARPSRRRDECHRRRDQECRRSVAMPQLGALSQAWTSAEVRCCWAGNSQSHEARGLARESDAVYHWLTAGRLLRNLVRLYRGGRLRGRSDLQTEIPSPVPGAWGPGSIRTLADHPGLTTINTMMATTITARMMPTKRARAPSAANSAVPAPLASYAAIWRFRVGE